jgi:hypothetical protein
MSTDNNILTVQENEDTGELFLTLPLDVINQVGWWEGELLDWINNGDGSWSIQKHEEE